MDRTLKVEVTNMAMIVNKKGEVLLQKRTKKDWPGWTLPGGHCEKGENLLQSLKREIKEETGLTINKATLKGVMEYKTEKGQDMYLVFLYLCKDFTGNLHDSNEGHLQFTDLKTVKEEEWAMDMDALLKVLLNEEYTDIVFVKKKDGSYVREIV